MNEQPERETLTAIDLHSLPEDYRWLLDVELRATDESIDDELHTLDFIIEETAEQMLKLGKAVKSLTATADLIAEQELVLKHKREAIELRAARLKAWMLSRMSGYNIKQSKDAFISVTRQANPPRVDVVSELEVPDEFKQAYLMLPLNMVPENLLPLAEVRVQKAEIMKRVKETGELPAGINVVHGEHIRVR